MGEHLDWKFTQVFGDKAEEVQEADVISAVEFDQTGDYLATGDRAGRIVIFEKNQDKSADKRGLAGRKTGFGKQGLEYRFYTEFQSHEPEFDYLKSLEIEEKINQIRWCKRNRDSLFLISTNDKTIKLWKVYEKKVKTVNQLNLDAKHKSSGGRGSVPITYLRVPRVSYSDTAVVSATPRRVYANAHAYHINSISPNSDGETFISADDLRINLWHLENNKESFNIVDMKPANMEELTEVITSAQLHPKHCNVFAYSSSRGCIKLCDMRASALCDKSSKVFEEEDVQSKSFFSEIIASVSDVKFSGDGRYLLARDYLTLKLWDVNMESRPVRTIQIHENLRSKLCDLYENDYIFDKFECTWSGCGNHVMTGSYFNTFHIYDRSGKTDTCIEATKKKKSALGGTKNKILRGTKNMRRLSADNEEFSKKVLHLAWHPNANAIAIAASSNLFIYNA